MTNFPPTYPTNFMATPHSSPEETPLDPS